MDDGWELRQDLNATPIILLLGRFLNLQDRSILEISHQCNSERLAIQPDNESLSSPYSPFLAPSLSTAAYQNSF